jgi:DNA polymerase-3 subunit chi
VGEVLFYHLTRSSTEEVAERLLPRALAQGWRVVVRGRDGAMLDRLDSWLWLHPEDGFLPHGRSGGPQDARQPVLLTDRAEAPNNPQAMMVIDRAEVSPEETARLQRIWILFDSADAQALEHARGLWRRFSGAGLAPQYWTEESGRWQRKAL